MHPVTSTFFTTLMMVANETVIQSRHNTMNTYNNYYLSLGIEPSVGEKCYGSFGCFDVNPPWTGDHRPVTALPEDLDIVHPNYDLYNRYHPEEPIVLDMNDVYVAGDETNMNVDLPLYVVIHGFTDHGNKTWMKRIKEELLKRDDCNVILVNWGRASGPPYPQAVANIRLAGAVTAHLLEKIFTYSDKSAYDRVHCIGHSLGAHMCGYIGYQLKRDFHVTMGRITGMDPAEPHFARTSAPVRLDRSAAKFVDVIHTDAGGFTSLAFGIVESVGHVDFFPNGGFNQPGCTQPLAEVASQQGWVLGMKKFVGCNHIRAYELFADSINNRRCPYTAISCGSYDDFKAGKCLRCDHRAHAGGNYCVTFGMESYASYHKLVKMKRLNPKLNHVMYLMTNDKDPFCKSHYKITVQISSDKESTDHGGEIGTLWFVMHSTTDGSGPKSDKIALKKESYHEPGAKYVYVLPGDLVSDLRAIEVEWKYQTNIMNFLTWRISGTPKIFVDHVAVEVLETNQRIKVCPSVNKSLLNSSPKILLPSYCKN